MRRAAAARPAHARLAHALPAIPSSADAIARRAARFAPASAGRGLLACASLGWALLAGSACSDVRPAGPADGSPEALVAYLETVASADAATRLRAVVGWQLDEPAWNRTVIALYRPLYADYARAFAAEAPAIASRLGAPHHGATPHAAISARRHFAGDPRLTGAEARDRWALPTLFPSLVAEAGGAPIDAVMVADGDHWRALIGLDTAVRARVAALAPTCAARLALAGPAGRCTDVGAAIVAAALRTDGKDLAHVCQLADALCGKEAP